MNFAIFAENAAGMELCLFNSLESKNEEERIRFNEVSHHVWHGYIPGIETRSALRIPRPWPLRSLNGLRYNPNKLLIDPYAKAISSPIDWNDALFGYIMGHQDEDLSFSETDSAPLLPKSVVIDPRFDWEGDKPPKIPYHKTIIYETHVKGLHTNSSRTFRKK